RTDLHILQRIVLATEGERLAGPAPAQDLHALLEQREAMLHGNSEGLEVRRLIADANPEDDAPLGGEIERDRILGHAHGMMERQEEDRRADTKPRRPSGHHRGRDDWRRQEPVLVLMVLAEEARVEAAGFGQLRLGDHLVDRTVEILATRRIRDRAVETEFQAGAPALSRAGRGSRPGAPRAPGGTSPRASGRRGCTASTAGRRCRARSLDPRADRAGTSARSAGTPPRPRRRWRGAAPCPAPRDSPAARARA